MPGVGDLRRDRRLSRQEESRRGDHLGATGGGAARAAVGPADRGRRRPCPRVARRARAVLRHAVAGRAGEHLRRARDATSTSRRSRPACPTAATRRSSLPRTRARAWSTRASRCATELDEIHVDIGILFPDHLLKLPVLTQTEYAAALARAYNAWLVDQWASVEHGLLGCIIACNHDPDRGRPRDRALRPAPGDRRRLPPLRRHRPAVGPPPLRPDLRRRRGRRPPGPAAQRDGHAPGLPLQQPRLRHRDGRATPAATPFSIMANVVHMITTGVPVRFPKLRIALAEAGVSWMPFIMQRLDKEYLERRRDVPFLTERPSHYLKQWYVATPAHRGARGHGATSRRSSTCSTAGTRRCSRRTGRTTTSTTRASSIRSR